MDRVAGGGCLPEFITLVLIAVAIVVAAIRTEYYTEYADTAEYAYTPGEAVYFAGSVPAVIVTHRRVEKGYMPKYEISWAEHRPTGTVLHHTTVVYETQLTKAPTITAEQNSR